MALWCVAVIGVNLVTIPYLNEEVWFVQFTHSEGSGYSEFTYSKKFDPRGTILKIEKENSVKNVKINFVHKIR